MKLPLRWGVVLLAGIMGLASWLGPGPARSLVLMGGIGVALWTAFSLNITPRSVLEQPPPEEDEASTKGEEEGDGGAAKTG